MQVTGKIKQILEPVTGQSKDGKEWKKITFVVSNNEGYEGAEQLFAFEIFGAEKVDKFLQYNKEGTPVDVDFNIRTNEYQGKYYTSLQAWKVFKAEETPQASEEVEDDSPF
jgi:hypothetical protein